MLWAQMLIPFGTGNESNADRTQIFFRIVFWMASVILLFYAGTFSTIVGVLFR